VNSIIEQMDETPGEANAHARSDALAEGSRKSLAASHGPHTEEHAEKSSQDPASAPSQEIVDMMNAFRSVLKKKFKNPADAFKGRRSSWDETIDEQEFTEAMEELASTSTWDESTKEFMLEASSILFQFVVIDKGVDGRLTCKEFLHAFDRRAR